MGFIFAVISGAAMSIQGVMNTRLGDKIGVYESNMYVQGTAFVLSLIVMMIFGKGSLSGIGDVNKLYLFGGVLGIIITLTVMKLVGSLSPTVAISTILTAQLVTAALIDAFGIMESEKIPFGWTKYLGIALMLAGVFLIKHRQ